MKYPSGEVAHVGDLVRLWYGKPGEKEERGVVVCSIDTDEYSADYQRDNWAHLEKGILVMSESAGLIHYTQPEAHMAVIERGVPLPSG